MRSDCVSMNNGRFMSTTKGHDFRLKSHLGLCSYSFTMFLVSPITAVSARTTRHFKRGYVCSLNGFTCNLFFDLFLGLQFLLLLESGCAR